MRVTNHLFDPLLKAQATKTTSFLQQSGRSDLSFAKLAGQTARFAHRLVETGLNPGDRVAAQVEKSSEVVALYLATVQAGGVFLPLNPAYTESELSYFIQDATPRVLICEPARETLFQRLRGSNATVLTLGTECDGTLIESAAALPEQFETRLRRPDDLAALLYTSGTTGRPKGAMLSHDNLLSNAQVLIDLWQITSEDVLIHALPIFHTHGLFVALNTALLAEARVHFLPRFDLNEIVGALPEATLMMGVPTFYTRLLSDSRLTHDLTANMRLFISGSAPLLAETHQEFTARTGHAILERYGMTETNMNTSNPYDGDRRPGTVGHPLPGVEVVVSDPETGGALEPGQVGSVEVRGDNVFSGYWNKPDKTAEDLRDNGFFITGDLGSFSADGYLSIVGRAKDLIITGGLNVYPKEVEELLNQIPGVAESAVIGVPDADFGEAIVAVIVPRSQDAVTASTIEAEVKTQLARFKQPRRYEFVAALPRNAMGKVQKNVLRDQYTATKS